jgi:uncharacterized protein (TIRG00374 family)
LRSGAGAREHAVPFGVTSETGAARPRLRRFEQFSFAAGVLLLGWLVYRIGPGDVGRNLAEIGWGFLVVLGLHGVVVLLNTLSWKCLLAADGRMTLRKLAPMLMAGDAVTAVNPIGLVGGSLVRLSLLSRALPPQISLISVVLASTTQFIGQVLFVLSGLPVVLTMIRDRGLKLGLLVFSACLLTLLAVVLVVAFSTGVQGWIGNLLGRIRWLAARWASIPERRRNLLAETLAALRKRPQSLVLSVMASWLAWQTGVVGTFIILRLLHQPVGWGQALAIEMLGVAIEGTLFFVPAKIGTQEGGKVLIFLAMGLPPAKGFALGLIQRLRELAWAAAGLIVLGRYQRRRPHEQRSGAS